MFQQDPSNAHVIELTDSLGYVGAFFYRTIDSTAGDGKIIIPILLIGIGITSISKKLKPTKKQYIGIAIGILTVLGFLHGNYMFEQNSIQLGWHGFGGGFVGGFITWLVYKAFGQAGTYIILFCLAIISLMLVTQGRLFEYVP